MDTEFSVPSTPFQNNTRALIIFTAYLTTNTLLTLLITYTIFNAYKSHPAVQSKKSKSLLSITAFTALAVLSLAVTWHYMLSFFALSYHSWATAHNVPLPEQGTLQQQLSSIRLGPWLKDVQLFRDAWETVVETPARTCWSMPIFFITTAWAIFVAREAPKRKIKHAWAYMVLGQLVAISFAMNLFYVAVLVHPSPEQGTGAIVSEKPQLTKTEEEPGVNDKSVSSNLWTPPQSIYSILLPLTFGSVVKATTSAGSPHFLLFLALPHVILLLPPIVHVITPRELGTVHHSEAAYDAFYKSRFGMIIAFGLLFEAVALYFALYGDLTEQRHIHRHSNVHSYPWKNEVATGGETVIQNLWRSLLDHPAVSSVGWDSVLCTTSVLVWRLTRS